MVGISSYKGFSQCNTSNATDCFCLDHSQTDCNLLPDIGIGYDCLANIDGLINHVEVQDTFKLSVSTPNTGHGPLRVTATDFFLCGTDTIQSPGGFSGTCPDGTYPHQLIKQRIYHKNGNTMTYTERWAGSMTYHPSHGHMHIDDWGVYSLRDSVPGLPPQQWPVIAEGAKLGFCLMDYGNTNDYPTHFRDADGQIIVASQIDNYGLGGGGFECGIENQGISVGYTDIYYYYLDGMNIPLPDGFCNGEYWLVAMVDPHNYFLEENENNNVSAAKVYITQQVNGAEAQLELAVSNTTTFCAGDSVIISAFPDALGYAWSNGQTTSSIIVKESGVYNVTMPTSCGDVVSESITVVVSDEEVQTPIIPLTNNELQICENEGITLTISNELSPNEKARWYESIDSEVVMSEDPVLNIESLSTSHTYYAQIIGGLNFTPSFNEPHNKDFGSAEVNGAQFVGELLFDVNEPFTLNSVLVYAIEAATANPRTIQVRNADDEILHEIVVDIPDGESRVNLNFDLVPGTGYRLMSPENPRLFRNDENVVYPYELTNGVGNLVGSNFGQDRYYYFYDWEVQVEPTLCTASDKVPVTVTVDLCNGIEQVENQFEVFPNPTKELLYLSNLNGETIQQVAIVDVTGKEIKKIKWSVANNTPIMVNDLPSGVYFLILSNNENQFFSKFVKQ